MKIINTNKLLESINNVGEFEDKIHPEVPASFADAVKDAREMEKKAEKIFDDKEKEAKDSGLGNTEKDREGYKIKYNPGAKKMHLEESLFEDIIESSEKKTDLDDLTDEEIFDVLYGKLTVDGELYTKDSEGNVTTTRANPGAGYDVSQVFSGKNSKGIDCIEVSAETEADLENAKDAAEFYECEYEIKKNNKYNKYPYSILIDYGSANLDKLIADKDKLGYKKESLTEAQNIEVKVYNFRPSTEIGRETYRKISEAGKLGNLQDMIEEMYPDEDSIGADEMNSLLSEKADWVLDMLDIHEDDFE